MMWAQVSDSVWHDKIFHLSEDLANTLTFISEFSFSLQQLSRGSEISAFITASSSDQLSSWKPSQFGAAAK